MTDPQEAGPRLTAEAEARLDELREVLPARIYRAARVRAEETRLDAISARHVDEAAQALMEGVGRRSVLKEWGDTMGGVLLGAGAQGLIAELTKQPPTDLNRLALTMYVLSALAGVIIIAWAKHR